MCDLQYWDVDFDYLDKELLNVIKEQLESEIPYSILCNNIKKHISNKGIKLLFKGKKRNVNSYIRKKYGSISNYIYKNKNDINIENIIGLPVYKNNIDKDYVIIKQS